MLSNFICVKKTLILVAIMPQVLWFVGLLLVNFHVVVAASTNSPLPSQRPASGCPRMCGDIEVPYPFAISDDCAWRGRDNFTITCDESSNPPRALMGSAEIANISLVNGSLTVFTPVSSICYTSPNTTDPGKGGYGLDITNSSFLVSATENVFTAIGCNRLAFLYGKQDASYSAGCITSCSSLDTADLPPDGDRCSGVGCCQTNILSNLTTMLVDWSYGNGTTPEYSWWNYTPCVYAFVGHKDWYKFHSIDLIGTGNDTFDKRVGDWTIPLVLDWAIRDGGVCQKLPPNADAVSAEPTASACFSNNSYCVNATQGPGYLCKCSNGYRGNPYITGPGRCTNINECEEYEDPCGGGTTCHDTDGDYKCKCKFGLRGDGRSKEGCQPILPGYAIAILAIFSVLVVACFFIMEVKRRKQRRFFDKNGGEILKSMGINIFTEKQLRKITNGYQRSIGEGAFGKVYRGIIDDGTQHVAVKCASMKGEVLPQEEFVNEITFQFRISHANLVRLVGCCLETDVPMLVFEFIPKGSLYNVLHAAKDPYALSLQERLNIAIGSAEALSYMHSHGGHNHVHGDIKSGNILLDNDFTPKVSDFGSAKLVCVASMYSKWCVSGDMSYIDPMYIKSGRFTEKSDVYSFGVVLLELITRKKAKDGENSLPVHFVKCCKEERNGRKLYDKDLLSDDNAQCHRHMECLDRVGALAVRCLMEDIDERPTMVEVLEELKQVNAIVTVGSGL